MFFKIVFCIILFIIAKLIGVVVVEFLTYMSKVIERKIKKDIDKQIKIEYNNICKGEVNMENIFTALIAYTYLVLFLLILYSKGEDE